MIFEQWDVALARFPFAEDQRSKLRPVLVLSAKRFNGDRDVAVVSMITTASGGRWQSDEDIVDLVPAGLHHGCVVRFKIATLARSLIDRRIGCLSEADRKRMRTALRAVMPLDPEV